MFLIWIYGGYLTVTSGAISAFWYSLGRHFGQLALVLLGVVVLPGILGRLRVEIRITRIITIYRRQLGILTFACAFLHFSLVRLFHWIAGTLSVTFPISGFERWGFYALAIMSLLFLTSNNFSVRNLGKWWKKLHRFIYVILWLLVLHTAIQRISVWSLFILFFAILEVVSWIVMVLRKGRDLTLSAQTETSNSQKSKTSSENK